MRLAGVDIRNYRSIFDDEADRSLRLDLGDGMNTLVGSNNCGKSNVLRAISLALDPNHAFDPERDAPAPRPFSLPTIRLRFVADGGGNGERQLLAAAEEYERGLSGGQETNAAKGEIILHTAFQRTGEGVVRNDLLLTPRDSPRRTPDDADRLGHALLRLRESVRFVLISSGESIESVLEGNFREILHSVVRERLNEEFRQAEGSRREYISRLQESLLAPLRDRLADELQQLFPEVAGVQLTPHVPSIERTLSKVGIQLDDLVTTPLSDKGTGVRGGVLVAMLSYLAHNATRGMVFAVEEPEAFLHPRAQEEVRAHLEHIGQARDVSLLVTTHSAHVVARSETARIFCVAKDSAGRTRIAQTANGDADHAPLLGDLYRESTLEELLARSTSFPAGTKAVLLVEGDGDERCLRLAAGLVGRPDLLDGIHIKPAGGTTKIVTQAILTRAATDLPVQVLLDNDKDGREARDALKGHHLKFQNKREVLTLAEVFPRQHADFPWEAEDVFAPALIQSFVDSLGTSVIDGSRKRPHDDAFHYDLNPAAKQELDLYLARHARPEHVERWIELVLLLRRNFQFPTMSESATDIVAAAPPVWDSHEGEEAGERVLVLAHKVDHARYTSDGVVVLEGTQQLPADLSHLAFYVDGAIQSVIPRIEGLYESIHFSLETVGQLESTGRAADTRAAGIIRRSLRMDDGLAGESHHVVLLSANEDPRTLTLDQPIANTRQRNERPLAWTVGPRVVSYRSLAQQPDTTDELDKLEREAENAE